VAELALAAIRSERPGGQAQQRRLARAVGSRERDPVPAADLRVEALVDPLRSVCERHALEAEHEVAGAGRGRKAQPQRARVGLALGALGAQPLDQLLAAVRLTRLARLRAEAVHQALRVGDPGVEVLAPRILDLAPLALLPLELGVVAAVDGEPPPFELGDAPRVPVEKRPVVRDHEHRARVAGQRLLEPGDRGQVEVIRRLVEEQDLGTQQQELRQLDPHEPAAG
jgi:hypothetical protein